MASNSGSPSNPLCSPGAYRKSINLYSVISMNSLEATNLSMIRYDKTIRDKNSTIWNIESKNYKHMSKLQIKVFCFNCGSQETSKIWYECARQSIDQSISK